MYQTNLSTPEQINDSKKQPMFPFQDAAAGMNYPGVGLPNGLAGATNAGGDGGGQGGMGNQSSAGNTEAMSPDATAAAVAAVAQFSLRQQMQMVAAAHNYPDAANLVSGLNHLNMYPNNNGGSANNMPMPKIGSPATSGTTIKSNKYIEISGYAILIPLHSLSILFTI